jgi:hypothetical protein
MTQAAQHLSIDPLNPPKDFCVLSIIQYKDERGNIVQDVQSHLMKDLRNEDYIMAMMDSAQAQLGNWFKEQKALRKIR